MSATLQATIVLVLSARAHPQAKLPPPETYVETVAEGAILKLVPRGSLYAASDPKQILRYYFKVSIRDGEVELSQVPDEYGKSDFFDLAERSPADGYGQKRNFSLRPGKPLSFFYNVPGGGPEWTLTLREIVHK